MDLPAECGFRRGFALGGQAAEQQRLDSRGDVPSYRELEAPPRLARHLAPWSLRWWGRIFCTPIIPSMDCPAPTREEIQRSVYGKGFLAMVS